MIERGDGALSQLISDGLCPRCHTSMPPVNVDGHIKCAVCQLVISECCQGERADEANRDSD